MQEVVGSNPTEGKNCFSHFTLLEWNMKNCFVKLIKTLKINRQNYFVCKGCAPKMFVGALLDAIYNYNIMYVCTVVCTLGFHES